MIQFSNRKMLSNPGVAILAIVFFVLQLATFVAGLYFLKNIYSNGTVAKDLATGSPYMQYSLGTLQWGLLIGMVVAWIWFFMFINNLGDYMISALICEDYFKTGGILGAVCNTLIWHCGSVALASAVMFPCAIWRFLYGWIHDLITAPLDPSNPGNKTKIQTIFKFACICCEWPYKKFAMRTGEHGFPMSYLASCNYCPATKEAYYLMRGYESVLGNMKIITLLFRLAGLVGIVALNSVIAQLVFTYLPYYQSTLSSPLVPTIVKVFLNAGRRSVDSAHWWNLHECVGYSDRSCPYLLPDRFGYRHEAKRCQTQRVPRGTGQQRTERCQNEGIRTGWWQTHGIQIQLP